MAAFHRRLRQAGQIAQHRQAGLSFQQVFEQFIQLFGAAVEQDARNMAVFAEVHKALDLCRQRYAGPSGLHHQQHRKPQRVCQLPCAGPGGQALPVVKAHGPLAHGSAVPGGTAGVKRLYRGPVREEQIQIMAVHLQSRTVEHGVDVVRPAFEGAGVGPALFQCRQHGAGHRGLAAAGPGRGDEELHHLRIPVMRKMGLFAMSR